MDRSSLLNALGKFPLKVPLRSSTLESVDCGSYVRDRVEYYTEPDEAIRAYVCIPKNCGPRTPAIFCHHQHNWNFELGKSEVVGLAGNPDQAYAAELAERGYITLAPDAIGFEERDWSGGTFKTAYFELTSRLVTGRTLLAKVLHDVSVGIDYLQSLDAVDGNRIGFIGHSYGGRMAIWAPAFDKRIRASVSNCGCVNYKNSLRRDAGIQMEFCVPGIMNIGDIEDIVALVAPTPLYISAAEDDKWSRGAQELFDAAKPSFPDGNLKLRIWPGDHEFTQAMREDAYAFLNNHLLETDASERIAIAGQGSVKNKTSTQEPIRSHSARARSGVDGMRLIGAVDIGGTKIAVGAVNEDGTVVHRSEFPTDPTRGFQHAMQRIEQRLHEAASAWGPFAGIGIACPGPLDPLSGIIGDVGTLPGWAGGNLVRQLEEDFGVTVAVENDADAAALAEYNWGAANGAGNLIFITVSTGIGGGIVLGGQIYRGVNGAHPELGHQVIDSFGPQCYCGAHGCWESLASGTAISAWVREQAPELSSITAAEVCALATKGDELAFQAVKREAHYLGLGLANLVTLFAPDIISLGGGVMKSSDFFLDDVRKVVRELCTQVPSEKTRIVLSPLGSEAGLLGAAQAWLCRDRQR